ncbi:MAG: sensor domain-containing diguanylate cyclase [Thermoleophilaceae bacterium]|nr:sensor domain-containing diguanylate cyclase [Thermoleophilaceae bacterium]
MSASPFPPDEEARITALKSLDILDSEYEERFDRITRLAQRLFGTEVAAVSMIGDDRQWMKSHQGPVEQEMPREDSFCAHTLHTPHETMVVGDASKDDRFSDNPLVTGDPHIRFYAGHPITAPGGEQIGAICVIDSAPRAPKDVDTDSLRDLAAMVESEIATLALAITDQLTGLSNRRGFEMLGERLYRVVQRQDLPLAVVYADVDNLKPINDNCGHEAGDRLLIEVADLIERELRESDIVARLGGDEFGALLTGAAAKDTNQILERLNDAIARRNYETDEPFEISLSIGVASGTPGLATESLERIVEAADVAMLAAKRDRKQTAIAS